MKIIKPEEFSENVFRLIGKKWALVAAYDENHKGLPYNALTASWGGMGVLWNKNVFWCFIRPQRYTKEFIDNSDKISLSFFDEKYRKALTLCGRKSGRDGDKLKEAGFTAKVNEDKTICFDEADITVKGRKLYAQEMKPECFADKSIVDSCYPAKDFHTMYVCEITSIELSEKD